LHRIHRADQDRPLHNHPWPNAASLILWGGYAESTLRGWYFYALGDRNRLTPETYHRIDSVLPGTWTLFFAGRRSRSWGFLTERGHVDYREYLGLPANHQLED
jgi:hypothetical protein